MTKADVRLALLVLVGAQAVALPVHSPKPGGVAVIAIGQGATQPTVFFDDTRVLVVHEDAGWYAIVGIPLSHPTGTASIVVTEDDLPGRRIDFEVVAFAYREQHLKVDRNYVVGPEKLINA